jgi:hypothetical protein
MKRYWWVNQGRTFKLASQLQCIWAPFTTKGYNSNGTYNSVIENYSLVNENREQTINLMYKYNLNANANYVSAFSINKNYLGQENNNNLNLFQGLSFAF